MPSQSHSMFDFMDVSLEVPDAAHGISVSSPSSVNRLAFVASIRVNSLRLQWVTVPDLP